MPYRMLINPFRTVPVGSWSFVGYCESATDTLNFGSLSAGAVAASDLLVYIDTVESGGTPTAVTPSGFTNHINTVSAVWRGMVSTKISDGTEGSITGMNETSEGKIGLVFRPGSGSYSTITASDMASELTNADPTSQTCDPSAEIIPVILIGIAGNTGADPTFTTFSPAADAEIANSGGAASDLQVGYKIYNSSPASHSIDMGDEGSGNWLASLYLTVL